MPTRIRLLAAPCLAIVLGVACHGNKSTETGSSGESFTVDGASVRLEDCNLRFLNPQGPTLRLALPPGCRFHRLQTGEVRVERTTRGAVAMVESSRKIPDTRDCETSLQAIVVQNGSVRLSEQVKKVAMCPPFQWDPMMFEVMSARTTQ